MLNVTKMDRMKMMMFLSRRVKMEPIEWIIAIAIALGAVAGMNWYPTETGQTSNCGQKTYY